jgi:parallel beta helix pectate lyase-like protein
MPRLVRRTLTLALALVGGTSLAEAQATRTWVSGVGDDANPCSRTAPCKTFAGAISKTAAGGEINALDPGGFGTVTITKSISIVSEGSLAGILAAGVNGVIVNAAATDVVVLRGLDINGAGTGLNGVRFLAGGSLFVENCTIYGFTGKGIDAQPSTAGQLFVTDTIIRDNRGPNGGGIVLTPTLTGSLAATLERVRLERNRFGLRVDDRGRVTIRDSVASGNNTNGFLVSSAGGLALLTLENSLASDNVNNGISAQGANATVRMSNVVVTGNGTGLSSGGAAIVSFGNNRVLGNGIDGAPTQTIGQQ